MNEAKSALSGFLWGAIIACLLIGGFAPNTSDYAKRLLKKHETVEQVLSSYSLEDDQRLVLLEQILREKN